MAFLMSASICARGARPIVDATIFPFRSMKNVVGSASSPPRVLDRLSIDQNRVVHVHFGREIRNVPLLGEQLRRIVLVELIGGNADDFQSLACVLVVQLLEPRNLDLARSAPRRPEVDHQRSALVARQRDFVAVQIGQRETGAIFPFSCVELSTSPSRSAGSDESGFVPSAAESGTSVIFMPCSFARSAFRRCTKLIAPAETISVRAVTIAARTRMFRFKPVVPRLCPFYKSEWHLPQARVQQLAWW
jgi:hypothetical protein